MAFLATISRYINSVKYEDILQTDHHDFHELKKQELQR